MGHVTVLSLVAEIMADNTQLACVYAALILHDDGIEITADKIQTLTKAAGSEVEPVWAKLFSSALAKTNVDDMIMSVGSGAGAAAPAAEDKPAAKAEAAEE